MAAGYDEFEDARILKDHAGNDRVVSLRKKEV
jgi:hypothetical protein